MTTALIVDDISMDQRLAGRLLEKSMEDVQILYAANGAEALASIEQSEPDIVITDLQMPDMNGLELVATVRSAHPCVPIILMTAHGSEEIAAEALRSGAASYVPKRDLSANLAATVERVLSASERAQAKDALFESMSDMAAGFLLPPDPTRIPPLLQYCQECLQVVGICDDTERVRVGIALEEALLNALYHGSLELSSDLRQDDETAFYSLAAARRKQEPYCRRRIRFRVTLTPGEGTFVVQDEGPGFDVASLPDPTDPANLDRVGGRGLLLIRTFMDEALHNETGNAITMVKRKRDMGAQDSAEL